jgi:hypothetical protein
MSNNFCKAIKCAHSKTRHIEGVCSCVKGRVRMHRCWYITSDGDIDVKTMRRIENDGVWNIYYKTPEQIKKALISSGHIKELAIRKLSGNEEL